jgi:hypothetical protein
LKIRPQSLSYSALFLLLYVFLPSFVLSIFLLLRIGSPELAYWSSLFLLAGFVFYNRKKFGVGDILLLLTSLVFCHVVAYSIFDSFYDGLAYHQPAVARIVQGFNPIYDGYMDFGRPTDLWSNQATYFPKATWYFAATVTAAWGDLQLGTVYHLLLLFAVMFFLWDATKGESFSKRFLWIVACLNPIALTQFTGYVVDGALGTLCLVGIFYAYLFFDGRPISRLTHFFCLISISLLFCVKTTGFAYGSIILFCVVLHRFIRTCRETRTPTFAGRLAAGIRSAFRLSLKLGLPVFLVVFILGFAPYVTNLLNGRHIFYPLIQSEEMGAIGDTLERRAQTIFPNAHNRYTRLLWSIISHTQESNAEILTPVRLKNPFDAPFKDWEPFVVAANTHAAGLGPLFFLFLVISLLLLPIFYFREIAWLLFLLLLLLFIQPYAWQMRYAPFLWILPLAFLLPIPDQRGYLLWIPFSVALLNTIGVFCLFTGNQWVMTQTIQQVCAPHVGEMVLLDQSVFEWDGIFDRFDLKQKYANPEETFFGRTAAELGSLSKARTAGGVNISFADDLLPVPETPLIFAQEDALPWLRMSEGLVPAEETSSKDFSRFIVWRTYANKVKFYMSLDRESVNDWEVLLRGLVFDEERERTGKAARKLSIEVFINHRQIGIWEIDGEASTGTFLIPRQLMEDSFRDEMRLVTLRLQLRGVSSLIENDLEHSLYGLQMEGIQIREKGVNSTIEI